MNIDAIPTGQNPPDDLNVIIEVPLGGEPIKYEIDKASGALFVDRFLYTPMRYPGNYGFIPHTLCGDGDPLDVLVMNSRPLVPGAVVRCRPLGVLFMEDDGGQDEKILAVPVHKLTAMYDKVHDITEPPIILEPWPIQRPPSRMRMMPIIVPAMRMVNVSLKENTKPQHFIRKSAHAFVFARSIDSRMTRLASAASPTCESFAHLPGSRSL